MSTKQKRKLLSIILAVATFTVAAAGGYFYLSLQRKNEEQSNSSITKVEPGDNEQNGSVDVSLQYAGYVTLLTDEKLVTLNFTNPSKAKKSLSLEIVAEINGENVTLAKTDKIRPGYKINNVKSISNEVISKGTYKGKFIVYFYNEEGKEEIVNSEININVYVK